MFGGAKKWSERKIKPKNCAECGTQFQPSCGGNNYCPSCVSLVKRRNHARATRIWRSKNREKHRNYKQSYDLKQYGITRDIYRDLLSKQGNKCAICGNANPSGRGVDRIFVVDHSHKTGVVRGLLCSACNTAIGLMKEDVNILEKAINYLGGDHAT